MPDFIGTTGTHSYDLLMGPQGQLQTGCECV